MKTFKDLIFETHPIGEPYKSARMEFDNGYGVSVVFGSIFYSNGVTTYEVGIIYDGERTYETDITNDVIGYCSEAEVTEIMIKTQQL